MFLALPSMLHKKNILFNIQWVKSISHRSHVVFLRQNINLPIINKWNMHVKFKGPKNFIYINPIYLFLFLFQIENISSYPFICKSIGWSLSYNYQNGVIIFWYRITKYSYNSDRVAFDTRKQTKSAHGKKAQEFEEKIARTHTEQTKQTNTNWTAFRVAVNAMRLLSDSHNRSSTA